MKDFSQALRSEETLLQEQFCSAAILKHSLIKLGPIHLQLTFTSCSLLRLALGTRLLNICFCSCSRGSSGRFYKWKSSFSWELQGHPLLGFFVVVVLCVGERGLFFPFFFKLNYRFGIAAIGFMPCHVREQAMRHWILRLEWCTRLAWREHQRMAEKFVRKHCHTSADLFFILVMLWLF